MPPSMTLIKLNAIVSVIKATFQHFTSSKWRDWDLTTHIQFEILRRLDASMLNWTIEDLQGFAMNYLPEPKEGWVIPVSIPVSQEDRQTLATDVGKLIAELAPELQMPAIDVAADVKGEWQGISTESPNPEMSDKERYQVLTGDVKSGPVFFHIHGGGYVTGSAAMERTATFRIAKTGGARIFAVDYRIAPQHPFPAGLLDALLAYKYLVDPPPGAFHDPVDPSNLIVVGDSAGGGLAIALVAILMKLKTLPLPAGVATLSPWVDFTVSFPSAQWDRHMDWPPCTWGPPHSPKSSPLWPPEKPRFSIYTDVPMHPFVSPVLLADQLSGFPPLMILVGDYELLRDECIYFAATHAKNGGTVHFQHFKSMPHTFVIFDSHPSTETCYQSLATFANAAVRGDKLETKMEKVDGKGVVSGPLDPKDYPDYSKSDLVKRMEECVRKRREHPIAKQYRKE